jgi:phage shock protein PspC (stress-responsive transcriptional regulator)
MTDRFYRSSKYPLVGGVCAGLGAYFRINTVLVRIFFILLTIVGGLGVLLYLVLWISVPSDLQVGAPAESVVAANALEIGQSMQEIASESRGAASGRRAAHRERTIWLAVAMIVVGVVWLAGSYLHVNFMSLWPLSLIAIGLGVMLHVLRRR